LIQTPAGAVGWRHAWRALPQGTAGFDRLKVGANHLVQSADFSTLLQFAAS